MKRFYLITALSVFFVIAFTFNSCDVPNTVQKGQGTWISKQEQLRRTYRGILETASSQMLKTLIKEFSPQSGKDAQYLLDLNNISYDDQNNMVSAKVLLTWQAREFLAGIPYGECQVSGTIYVYMPIRTFDSTEVILIPDRYNAHLRDVSTNAKCAKLERGIRIILN
ncbi:MULTISPECIES: hypothetical protein [Porphyromonas]|uniref:hypothetical protein n=1 Tax=Porphyromonas TaxID=836 RepID=UPI0003AD1C1B|nr:MULTISPECIES: hypothetical protein [Porphyromonas]ALA93681.1 hypothetical protein PGJ_00010760 [Porphyromonas gingivalis AJW4]ERJ69176.1 hypothetical protein HMPREF1553_00699 [Porphyromonas gingivalis F0568]MDP0530586.1 hypothetical protein [Porphyromonas gingivalis]MDP0624766.1 hypothetical protein [Porphyromonas gingivalis]OWR76539.1 hypothetical protein SJDPG4_01615 [Porphyromonas gingivalis SJD4]